MTLGLHENRRRRRRQIQWRILRWLLILAGLIAAGVFAYETGSRLAEREVIILKEEIVELKGTIEGLEARTANLTAAKETAEAQRRQSEARYQKDVPTGQLAAVLKTVQAKLEAGVTMDRLAFLIEAAENPRSCEANDDTKRFILRTPLYKGANDSVRLHGAIVVTGSGEPAKNDQGQVEAWYDPAQPVTLNFAETGGKTWSETALLPLHKSIVVRDKEYRFSVTEGKRGFVEISSEVCDFP